MYEIELSKKKAAKFYQKADAATSRRLNAAFVSVEGAMCTSIHRNRAAPS
jgi:hypothetical protein